MTDARIVELSTIEGPFFDLILRDAGTLDEREELATAVRLALGTDSLSDGVEILPDPDSTDRRGWWGDFEAEIWGGWPIGCKNWLLSRAKITGGSSSEGATLLRAKQYTLAALQPFIDKRIATRIEVEAVRTELQRIEVNVILYRGPKDEIDLRYQFLWQEEAAEDIPLPVAAPTANHKIRVPYRDLVLSPTAAVKGGTQHVSKTPLQGNIRFSSVQPGILQVSTITPLGNLALSTFAPTRAIGAIIVPPAGNLVRSSVAPTVVRPNNAYPIAVSSTFTATYQGMAESFLYDGYDSTAAGDPYGARAGQYISYDFGSAQTIRRLRAITSTAGPGGYANAITYSIGYSDTSLTSGFTYPDTIVVPAGISQNVVKDISSYGAHRYWQIIYSSGTAGGLTNLGELTMFTA